MRVTNILMLEQHLMPDYAHPAHPTNTHTHQQKGHCLPDDLCQSHLQPTQPFFQFSLRRMRKFSYHTTAQKQKKIRSIIVLIVHINRIQLYLNSTSPRNQYKLKP